MSLSSSRPSTACLALCCVVLAAICPAVRSGAQAAPQTGPRLSERNLRCPVAVKSLVSFAPEESVAAVKAACEPTGDNFCEACICTVFANFVPATLRSAGILKDATPPTEAETIIGSCAPNSHVALLRLGALNEDWSAALNAQCNDTTPHSNESGCDAYAPEKLPVKKAGSPPTAAAGSRCPFEASDIKPEELQEARQACGGNTNSTRFCRNCLCAMQSSITTIISKREALLSNTSAPADDEYKGCYIILTQALVEGQVLTPTAAAVLGSGRCRPFSKLAPAVRKAACKSEAGPKAPSAAPADANATPPAPTDSKKRSAGIMQVPVSAPKALLAVLVAVLWSRGPGLLL